MNINNQQKEAIYKINKFINSKKKIFFLKGYAGTGKTTIIKEILKNNSDKDIKLLAATGRAAKIMKEKTGVKVKTIHKEIFKYSHLKKQKDGLYQNEFKDNNFTSIKSIYIIDESSMIGNIKPADEKLKKKSVVFSDEMLLDSLLKSITKYNKIIFIGDPLQLPPVINKDGVIPALDKIYLKENYNLDSEEVLLTKIERQATDTGIVFNSLKIREAIKSNLIKSFNWDFEKSNIERIKKKDIIDTYLKDINNSMIICRSNVNTLKFSREVRKKLNLNNLVAIKDRLLVIKNNYKVDLMNGEIIKVCNILIDTREVKKVIVNKQEIELEFIDICIESGDGYKKLKILLNFLNSETYPLNDKIIQSALIELVIKMKGNDVRKLEELLNENSYYNSVQVRYAYALTCHKAQGGEAKSVIIEDINIKGEQDLKWLYTAITRAVERVYIYINTQDEERNTTLIEVAWSHDEKRLEELLKAGANPNIENKFEHTALMKIFHFYPKERKSGSLSKLIKLLLEYGIDTSPSKINPILINSLHIDDSTERNKVIKLLLKFGAEVNIVDNNGWPVLTRCISSLNIKSEEEKSLTLKILLANGVDPNFSSEQGMSPLMIDSSHRELLLKNGADPNLTDINGHTALYRDIIRYKESRWHKEIFDLKKTEILLKNGANPNIQNRKGETPLFRACKDEDNSKNIEAIKLLLEYNADPNIIDNEGNSPLLSLLKPFNSSTVDVYKLLIEYGASVNQCDKNGDSPLIILCRNYKDCYDGERYEEILKLLIKNGANINIQNNKGNTPFMEMLISYSNNWMRKERFKKLIELGSNINIKNKNGENALMMTVKIQEWNVALKKEYLEFLLDEGAEINSFDKDRNTPLHIVLENYHNDKFYEKILEEKIEILVSRGANLKQKNNTGKVAHSIINKYSNQENKEKIMKVFEKYN